MNRRSFLGLGSLFLAPQGAPGEVVPPENDFATSYNAWIALRTQETPGIVDAREIYAWEKVEKDFMNLRRVVRSRR